MVRFQPVLPLLHTNITRRRVRTWQILGLIVVLFLGLTFIAVRYLPTVVIDPISVLQNPDFQVIFAPPIPRPPINLPAQDHNHSLHIAKDQSEFRNKIQQDHDALSKLGGTFAKDNTIKKNITFDDHALPVDNLTALFSRMSIDELQQIQSAQMRREKVREVSLV